MGVLVRRQINGRERRAPTPVCLGIVGSEVSDDASFVVVGNRPQILGPLHPPDGVTPELRVPTL
jgi:hypothetical protein